MMPAPQPPRHASRAGVFVPVVIVLLGFALRSWQLVAVPPGLTHDEAAHGHDAAHVLTGVRPIYFTVGYGREPLFDYLNAALVAGLGARPLTLRFAALAWGTLALAATYRTTQTLFGRTTAVLAVAFMAASFWPLATSRQALRSAMLPAQMAIAVALFLKLSAAHTPVRRRRLYGLALGLVLAASLYTYIPARVLWLMFPLAALLGNTKYPMPKLKTQNSKFKTPLFIVHCSLFIAFALASPLFLYLARHPEAEQRIGMLSQPLAALQTGDAAPLLTNARETLLALFLPGHGDTFLAYNIPGKPVFDPLTAAFAIIGLVVALRHAVAHRRTAILPLWLALGIAPALVTGPMALTTRIIGAQPALYILPALGLSAVSYQLSAISRRFSSLVVGRWSPIVSLFHCSLFIVSLFIVSLLTSTARDYFIGWAQSPDVRAAYQSTLVAALNATHSATEFSTVYPSAPHDPYIAELTLPPGTPTRWADARAALVFPADPDFQLIVPASTPLHPRFAQWLSPAQTASLRPTDLDPAYTVYRFTGAPQPRLPAVNFNGAMSLVDYYWSAPDYRPGDVAELITVWRVLDPARLGPVHPPAFVTDLNLFTHLLNPDGSIFLQRDSLDAPSWAWQRGDTVIQIHQFALPPDAAPGHYLAEAGLYDRLAGDRLPVLDSAATSTFVTPLTIRQP
ncbi:MAG: hypothetical protein HY872_03160 [Chloroflexi bacterium]|nr:hypothetical protein [Chloroflexota bacterium]